MQPILAGGQYPSVSMGRKVVSRNVCQTRTLKKEAQRQKEIFLPLPGRCGPPAAAREPVQSTLRMITSTIIPVHTIEFAPLLAISLQNVVLVTAPKSSIFLSTHAWTRFLGKLAFSYQPMMHGQAFWGQLIVCLLCPSGSQQRYLEATERLHEEFRF